MKGKNALVTGSTSGIGPAVAEGLTEAGANVVLNGFGDAAKIERMRAELATRHGVQGLYSAADKSRPEQIAATVQEAAGTLGGVDVAPDLGLQRGILDQMDFPPLLRTPACLEGRFHRDALMGGRNEMPSMPLPARLRCDAGRITLFVQFERLLAQAP